MYPGTTKTVISDQVVYSLFYRISLTKTTIYRDINFNKIDVLVSLYAMTLSY